MPKNGKTNFVASYRSPTQKPTLVGGRGLAYFERINLSFFVSLLTTKHWPIASFWVQTTGYNKLMLARWEYRFASFQDGILFHRIEWAVCNVVQYRAMKAASLNRGQGRWCDKISGNCNISQLLSSSFKHYKAKKAIVLKIDIGSVSTTIR